MQEKRKKQPPLKQSRLYGAEGQAVISNNQHGLRQDDVYPELQIIEGEEFTNKFGRTKTGWDKAIYSNNTLVNIVGRNYSVLSNQNYFGEIEKQLKEKDINTMIRAVNRDNRAFCVDHILADDRYAVIVKNGKDEIRPMMSYTTSYDGSTKTQGHFGFFRKVCGNGLHVATSEIGFSLKRRGDLDYIVIGEVEKLIEKFMDNEFYEIKKKFEVLAETPLKDVSGYVKMVCDKTGIFQFEKSEENKEPSKMAETVIQLIKREAKQLDVEPNAWLGYNGFNSVIHDMKKTFNAQFGWDSKLFDYNMELVGAN